MNPSDDLVALVWSQLWQVTVLIAVVGLVVRLGCRHRPHLAHLLWLVVFVKCLTPPVVSSATGVFSWAQYRGQAVETPRVSFAPHEPVPLASNVPLPDTLQVPAVESPAAAPPRRSAITLTLVVGGVWLLGVFVLCGLALFEWWRCARVLSRRAAEGGEAAEAALAAVAGRLGLRRRVRLAVVSARLGPAVFGFLRPTVVVPEALLRGQTREQIEPMLAHELVHLRRGDALYGLLQFAAQAVWWFHPLVWWANRQACRACERCCDEEVVAGLGCPPKTYARCLLEVLDSKHAVRPIFAFPGVRPVQVTSQRLEAIMRRSHAFHRRTPRWCWALMMATAAVALPGAALVAENPAAGNAIRGLAQETRIEHTVTPAEFKEGWQRTVAVPTTPSSVSAVCDLWIQDGWLYAKRTSDVGTEWQVVLARVADGRVPRIFTIESQPGIQITYLNGRYFVRDSGIALRVLRQRKEDDGPFFVLDDCLPHGATIKGIATYYRQLTVSEWEDREWHFVASGPDQDRFDCFVRLNPKSHVNPGWGSTSTGNVQVFHHGDTWGMDDGELLIARRTLPDDYRREQMRAKISGAAPPEIQAAQWLNTDRALAWNDLKGKVVLLDFWATSCSPCVAAMPELEKLHREYAQRGLVVLGIHSAEGAETCADFAKKHGLTFPIAVDTGKTYEAFAVDGQPTYLLIDSSGNVVSGYSSRLPAKALVESLLKRR